MGIGDEDGHIAFNIPETPFDSSVHVVDLNQESVKTIQTRYAYDSSGMTRYYVYEDSRGDISTCNEGAQDGKYYSGYCSAFIHRSGLFGKIRGVQHSSVYSYQDLYKNWDYFSVFYLLFY